MDFAKSLNKIEQSSPGHQFFKRIQQIKSQTSHSQVYIYNSKETVFLISSDPPFIIQFQFTKVPLTS